MKKSIYLAVVFLALALATCVIARPLEIYSGQSASAAGIKLGSWGSGSASDVSEKSYAGPASIKVVTQGLFKGGYIEFSEPIQLVPEELDKSEYLQFTLNYTAVTALTAGAGATYTPLPGMAQAFPGVPQTDYMGEETSFRPKVTRIRLLLQDSQGVTIEVLQPVTTFRTDGSGWGKTSIPLAALKWPSNPKDFKLKRLVFCTDVPDTIYIGEIKIISDNTPITADAGEEQVVAARDIVTLRANAEGGASTLEYFWDFDKSDGIQEDAIGEIVTAQYNKRGEYTVTLTVKDYYGLKEPATATVLISVGD